MTEFMKTYKLKITVLSPVHIGASSDLEPTEYVIYKKTATTGICPKCGEKFEITDKTPIGKGHYLCPDCLDLDLEIPLSVPESSPFLYTFTPGQLSEALPQNKKTELLNIVKRDDSNVLRDLQKFFRNNAETIAAKATKRAQVAFSIAKTYNEMKTDNRFYIARQISDPVTGLPYIPGSSIKGAIRTALMSAKNKFSALNRQGFIRYNDKKGRNEAVKDAGSIAEKQLYGYDSAPAQDAPDPFKALKLCDAVSDSDLLTKICPAQRTGKKGNIPSNIEVIPENASFVSSLSIMQDVKPVNFGETIETIRTACNEFYLDVLNNEINKKWDKNIDDIIKTLEEKAAASNAFILNLGKNGGAESKTIKGLRIIENRQQHTLMEHSGTYWFANDGRERLPFGWCVVEFEEVK